MFQDRGKTTAIDIIIILFASIAKTNTLLMSNSMISTDKANLFQAIKRSRFLFQQLLKAAAAATLMNPRSRLSTL